MLKVHVCTWTSESRGCTCQDTVLDKHHHLVSLWFHRETLDEGRSIIFAVDYDKKSCCVHIVLLLLLSVLLGCAVLCSSVRLFVQFQSGPINISAS